VVIEEVGAVLALLAVLVAVGLAVVVIRLARRPAHGADGVDHDDGRLGRASVAAAVMGLVALAAPWLVSVAMRNQDGRTVTAPTGSLLFSIVCGFAAAILGGYAVLGARERHWTAWAGLAVGGVIALFWVAFAVGEVIAPH
jgi:hypothetical protein